MTRPESPIHSPSTLKTHRIAALEAHVSHLRKAAQGMIDAVNGIDREKHPALIPAVRELFRAMKD